MMSSNPDSLLVFPATTMFWPPSNWTVRFTMSWFSMSLSTMCEPRAVTYVLHVSADGPPTTITTDTDLKHGCPS